MLPILLSMRFLLLLRKNKPELERPSVSLLNLAWDPLFYWASVFIINSATEDNPIELAVLFPWAI